LNKRSIVQILSTSKSIGVLVKGFMVQILSISKLIGVLVKEINTVLIPTISRKYIVSVIKPILVLEEIYCTSHKLILVLL